MALTKKQILEAILLAYALTPDEVAGLAANLAVAQLAAMTATYSQAASVVGASAGGWQPADDVKQAIEDQLAQDAAGIADTFVGLVQNAASAFLDGWAESQDSLDGAASALATTLTGTADTLTGWKADQIADCTLTGGIDDGTDAFCADYLAGDLLAGDDIDPSQLAVAVLPMEATGEDCEPYAGELFDIEEYQVIPDFPLHPGCKHHKTVVYLGAVTAAWRRRAA